MSEPCTLIPGDCLDALRTLPDASVHCCVTSPPYYGLRDYGIDGQIGLEATPDAYVARMVEVFREVRRVLRDDGALWLNLGDSYASGGGVQHPHRNNSGGFAGSDGARTQQYALAGGGFSRPNTLKNVKPKDLIGIPWRVAFALQADGWYLRQDIVWHKPNPMPESVRDRCTKAHEYVFLLSKRERYYFDAEAIREPSSESSGWAKQRARGVNTWKYNDTEPRKLQTGQIVDSSTFGTAGLRNRRSVWTVATRPFKEAHFATMPPGLVEPCVLAGTSEKGCCPTCGAGWVRVVERHICEGVRAGDGHAIARGGDRAIPNGKDYYANPSRSETTGWRPACDCPAPEPVPCVVLDPFSGAGTTGVVALRHGRRYVGIELNPAYLEMSRRRIEAELSKSTLLEAAGA